MAITIIGEVQGNNDYSEIHKLLILLRNPFEEQPQFQYSAQLRPNWTRYLIVSCSS
jgi:uncharacterized protein YdiU (UPF0061 family)